MARRSHVHVPPPPPVLEYDEAIFLGMASEENEIIREFEANLPRSFGPEWGSEVEAEQDPVVPSQAPGPVPVPSQGMDLIPAGGHPEPQLLALECDDRVGLPGLKFDLLQLLKGSGMMEKGEGNTGGGRSQPFPVVALLLQRVKMLQEKIDKGGGSGSGSGDGDGEGEGGNGNGKPTPGPSSTSG